MKIGIVGLGKMGSNIATNFIEKGVEVVGYDEKVISGSIAQVESLEELVKNLSHPRKLWVMVPSGSITDTVLENLMGYLDEGDIVIDAGNSHFQSSIDNYNKFKERGIKFLDCGTSGGTEGALNGACFMIGGDQDTFNIMEPYFKLTSTENGYGYVGQSGSGHYLKMIHNGIEYGMMQSIAEGFNILEGSQFDYEYSEVSKIWSHGSIISGYLMTMMSSIFSKEINIEDLTDVIDSSGEGKWTLMEALSLGVSTPAISAAMNVRNHSSNGEGIQNQLISLMRNEFGGHPLRYKEKQ